MIKCLWQVNLTVDCAHKSRGGSCHPPKIPEAWSVFLLGPQFVYRERPAFYQNGYNGGDPPRLRGSCPDPIFQPGPCPHCPAAGDAYSLLTKVWHEPGMVPKVSLVFVHVVLT